MQDRLARRNPHVLFQSVGDGAVLLDTSTEVYYSLNAVGARICALLPEYRTLDSLCEALAAEYPTIPMATLRADARELLDELVSHGLLNDASSTPPVEADNGSLLADDGDAA